MFVLVLILNTQVVLHDFDTASACAEAVEVLKKHQVVNSAFCIPKGYHPMY